MLNFRQGSKNYKWDKINNKIYTQRDIEVTGKQAEELIESAKYVAKKVSSQVYDGGFSYSMFTNYVYVLDTHNKNELFHIIYESYLYVQELVNSTNVSIAEYHKCMAKIKRLENYLYIILKS